MSFFDLSARTIDGSPAPLADWKGRVLLVVNTASECGLTPQYAGLQKLQESYGARGFSVVGIPSNDFGRQEPGSAEQICEFTSQRYKVTFPLLEKSVTKGEGQSPVFAFLTKGHSEPKWNFHKYLIGRDGTVVQDFGSQVEPESAELKQAIEAALAK
jgi:glutathione peroxidase